MTFQHAVRKHAQYLKDGFQYTILQRALQASDSVDVKALTWWLHLPALAEASKAQDILACIPKEVVTQLMVSPIQSGKLVLLKHLISLLQSCGPDLLAGRLDEKERRTRLLVSTC